MKQNIAVDKALRSIQCQLREQVLNDIERNIIYHHLWLLYGVGFNEGLKEHHILKPVEQYNDGGSIHKFCTVKDAANYMKVSPSSIYKAISHPNRKCCGSYWRYL